MFAHTDAFYSLAHTDIFHGLAHTFVFHIFAHTDVSHMFAHLHHSQGCVVEQSSVTFANSYNHQISFIKIWLHLTEVQKVFERLRETWKSLKDSWILWHTQKTLGVSEKNPERLVRGVEVSARFLWFFKTLKAPFNLKCLWKNFENLWVTFECIEKLSLIPSDNCHRGC